MLNFQLFYRRYGIRLLQQLAQPQMRDILELELPMNSIYHYCDFEGIQSGPKNEDVLFRGNLKPIQVSHVLELKGEIGFPRKLPFVVNTEIKDYHMQNRRTRWLRNIDSVLRDPQTLIVYNYSLLIKTYKYVRSFFSEYYKWYNLFDTMIENIVTSSDNNLRQHYFTANIPKVIPSLQQLELAATQGMNQTLLKVFRDKDGYMLIELWKWLHDDDSVSEKSIFSKIPKDKLHLVNIIYLEDSKWTVLNLGMLYSFTDKSLKYEELVNVSKQKLKPLQLQKRLLRLIMSIMEVRTLAAAQAAGVDLADVQNDEITNQNKLADVILDPITKDDQLQPTLVIDHGRVEVQDTLLDDQDDEETVAKRIKEEDDLLDQELAQLNEIAKRQENDETTPSESLDQIMRNPDTSNLEDGILDICNKLADDGLLSAAEYKRFNTISSAYKNIIAPNGQPMHEFVKIKPEELLINESPSVPDKDTVLDKTMLKSSLIDFDSKYIEKVLPKDTFNMVLNLHKAGVAVTDYKVETTSDILGSYETHVVKLQPVIGKQSTIRFKIPVIEKNGVFTSNAVKYRLRKQKGDLPIRKIDSNEISLTSYYGKTFITRGRKKIDDYGYWLVTQIVAIALNKENNIITDMLNSDVFDQTAKTPRAYSAVSNQIKSLKCRGFTLSFDYRLREKLYTSDAIKKYEKHGNVIFGKDKNDNLLILDQNNTVYIASKDKIEVFGTIEHFLNIDILNAPVEYAEVSIFGKDVPIGVVLAYFLGLEKLIKLLKVTPRRIQAHTRLNLAPHEWVMQFSDETLVFSREDRLASIILGGFNSYHKTIKMFSIYSFDKKGVYLNLLEANGLSTRYLREIELMNKMFIDPITKDILIQMKEPTTFQGLLFRSCEMLLNDEHPDALDPRYMRVKGYERISGAIYTELVQAVRFHEGRLGKSNTPIELNPYAVWKRITEDPSKSQVNEINPIESLKEVEAVTFSGTGGRNKRSMTKSTRTYHKNNMGTISESTVDSSDVGINVFTSADPQFDSLRGTSKEYKVGKTGVTALLSTSALLAPGSDHDDSKRVNFVAIQASHAVSCQGYHQFTTRTGYDSVIPDRTYDLFAFTAKKPGKVKSIDKRGVIIEYEDGETTGYEIGRRFGNAAGLVIPHNVVTPLKENDVIKIGDVIVYNDGFFEPDFFDEKKIVLKNSINVKTVLWESHQTLEDASSISKKVTDKLTTKVTKVKNIIVTFDQAVSSLVNIGDIVNADSILCIIEDAVTANNNLFSDKSIDTLRLVSAQTPKANVKGVIEKIEIFYHGDKEDMSESLKKLADINDKQLKEKAKSLNTLSVTGSVDSGLRIENNPLGLDNMVIRIYITSNVGLGLGD
jgi:hypothetical protein